MGGQAKKTRHEMCWLRSGAAAYLPTKQTRPKRPSLNQKQGIRLADWAELLGVGYPVASCLNLLCFSWNLARVARGVYSFTNTTNGLPGGQARRKSRATRGPNCEPGFGPEINLNLRTLPCLDETCASSRLVCLNKHSVTAESFKPLLDQVPVYSSFSKQ